MEFDSFVRRLVVSVLVFVGGMNAMGVWMISNGHNYQSNPAWNLFSGFFAFEITILKILGAFLVLGLGIFIGREVFGKTKPPATDWKPARKPEHLPELNSYTPEIIETSRPISIPEIPLPSIPAPTPRPLTAEELKQKAINELTVCG